MKKEQPVPPEKNRFSKKMALYAVAGLLVVVGSFFGGMQFQKGRGDDNKDQRVPRQTLSLPGPREGGPSFRRGATISTVTAVSETSISVKSQRGNAETTYAITSDTKIINGGATATYADIKVGDKVIVTASGPSDTTSKTAMRILLDPPAMPESGSDSNDSI